jgi:hypothetical protein
VPAGLFRLKDGRARYAGNDVSDEGSEAERYEIYPFFIVNVSRLVVEENGHSFRENSLEKSALISDDKKFYQYR